MEEQTNLLEGDEAGVNSLKSMKLEVGNMVVPTEKVASVRRAGGSLVVLQVNCRSIYKLLEFSRHV